MNRMGKGYMGMSYPRLIVFAALAVLLAVVFWPVLVRRATLLPHAPGMFFDGPAGMRGNFSQPVLDPWGTMWEEYPLARVVRGQFSSGIPPLWNPWTACGTPLLANMHSEALSPVRWPLFIARDPLAWDLYFLFRLLAAGFLCGILALELGLGLPGALVSGVAWAFGGYLILYLNLFHLDIEVFLPGLLLCLTRVLRGGGVPWLLGLSAVTAQMILGGNPEATLVDFFFAFIWAAVISWRTGRTLHRVSGAVLAVAGGLALSLPLLLPFAEFFLNAFHIHSAQSGAWWGGTTLDWRGWPAFLVPMSYGGILKPVGFSVQGLLPWFGTGVFLLAVQGAGWGRDVAGRLSRLMTAVVVLELAKIYGIPPLNWVGTLPGFSLIVWTKYAAPLFLSMALLAGMGIQRLAEGRPDKPRLFAGLAVLAAGAVTAFASTCAPLHCAMGWGFALFFIVPLAILSAYARRRGAGRASAWLASVLVVVELVAWVPRDRLRPFDPLASVRFAEYLRARLPDAGAGRVFGLGFNLVPHTGAALGLADPRAMIDPLVFRPFWEFMDSEVAEPRRPAFMGFLKTDRLDRRALEALSFMGVRYLVSTRSRAGILAPGGDWPLVLVLAGEMNVYENPRAWSRAFVLGKGGGAPVPARIMSYTPMTVDISVPAVSGRLVLTDTAYPGWRAFLDGKRVPVIRHARAFRAVEVPGREVRVRFSYAPLPFALGLWLAGVLGLGALLSLPFIRR